jgi:hypothetical protein
MGFFHSFGEGQGGGDYGTFSIASGRRRGEGGFSWRFSKGLGEVIDREITTLFFQEVWND